MAQSDFENQDQNPPVFNIPRPVLVLVLLLLFAHTLTVIALTENERFLVLLYFSFIPAVYGSATATGVEYGALYWRPFSYIFLHGDWLHVMMNCVWLTIFGSPVARRLGWARFGGLFLAGGVSGVLVHYALYSDSLAVVIGASASVSALMGAAIRFAFQPGQGFQQASDRHLAPSLTLLQSLTNRNVLMFVGFWLAINWFFGSGIVPVPGIESAVAWEAHVGGFALGFLGFGLFDRRVGSLT